VTLAPDELIVDLFAGGGGASLGIHRATGRHPDIAVNHDPIAVGIHRANHADTMHHCASVWHVEPRAAVAGLPGGLTCP
jgi:DNA (cytosine-5)-methyltransferase 1